MKKLAITGGRGMLGTDIGILASEKGYRVNLYDLPEFDIRVRKDVECMLAENDVIVNCAAYTAVDRAESELELCMSVNADAVGVLGEIAECADKYVLHISTDFVFGDSGDSPLNELDATAPLGVYGASKLTGERLLQQSGCRCGIIRIQWTYGKHGGNFITKILELGERLENLKVVDDQFGAPTATATVATAVLCFLESEIEGVYHFASRGYASRFEVARYIVEQSRLNTNVTPCNSDGFPSQAKRPFNSRFDCSKIDHVLDFKRPEWRKDLRNFLSQRQKIH